MSEPVAEEITNMDQGSSVNASLKLLGVVITRMKLRQVADNNFSFRKPVTLPCVNRNS